MTPEQDTLADIVAACRQLVDGAERDRADFLGILPVDEAIDAVEPTGVARHLLRSFIKLFEQVQDQVSRKLLRAVLAVQRPSNVSGSNKLDAVIGDAAALIGLDAARLRDYAVIRNSLAHDYAMTFVEVAPVINSAWRAFPEILAVTETVIAHIETAALLEPRP